MEYGPGNSLHFGGGTGFEGVQAPEILVGKCWTPFGIVECSSNIKRILQTHLIRKKKNKRSS